MYSIAKNKSQFKILFLSKLYFDNILLHFKLYVYKNEIWKLFWHVVFWVTLRKMYPKQGSIFIVYKNKAKKLNLESSSGRLVEQTKLSCRSWH